MAHTPEQLPPALVLGETELVHNLGPAGITVYVGAEDPRSPAMHSRYAAGRFTFSSYDSDRFIDELCDAGRQLGNRAVIYTYDDRALVSLSRHRERLRPHFRFLYPEPDIVEKVLDKRLFCRLAEERRLPAPASFEVATTHELADATARIARPYLVKPAYRHFWYRPDFAQIVGSYQKAFVCRDTQELKELYARIQQVHPAVVVQQYIEGDDDCMYDVNLFIDSAGAVRGYVIARKLRVYPAGAGWGSFVKTVHDSDVLASSLQVAAVLDMRGLVNLQYKKDARTGEPRLIEVHPRSSIFDILGVRAGVNLLAMYHFDVAGAKLPAAGDYDDDVSYIHLQRDIKAFLELRRQGRLSAMQWLASYRGKKVIADLLLSDPLPLVLRCGAILRKRLARGARHAPEDSPAVDSASLPPAAAEHRA